jgi:spore photoproduct lyase
MNEEDRRYKYGQFGYGKYVYRNDELAEMEDFFRKSIAGIFPAAKIDYII